MIQTNYDAEADVFHVKFGPDDAVYDGSEEVAPGVFLEFDAAGTVIGVEVLSMKLRQGGTYGIAPVQSAAE
jgi:uncharacterized protein YuzE